MSYPLSFPSTQWCLIGRCIINLSENPQPPDLKLNIWRQITVNKVDKIAPKIIGGVNCFIIGLKCLLHQLVRLFDQVFPHTGHVVWFSYIFFLNDENTIHWCIFLRYNAVINMYKYIYESTYVDIQPFKRENFPFLVFWIFWPGFICTLEILYTFICK